MNTNMNTNMNETDDDTVYALSADIGKKNFALLVERFNRRELEALPKIPKTQRYRPDGTATPEFAEVLRQVCKNGEVVFFKNSDLTQGCAKGSYLDPKTYHNMTSLLDEYRQYWNVCEAFVIERQMAFRGKYNTMALKLGQHCYSYFAINYGPFKEYYDFPAYHKTQILGAAKIEKKTKTGKVTYKAIDKPARKKWSVDKASAILAERDDFDTLSMLGSSKKADDLADCLTMLQSWKYLRYVDNADLSK